MTEQTLREHLDWMAEIYAPFYPSPLSWPDHSFRVWWHLRAMLIAIENAKHAATATT